MFHGSDAVADPTGTAKQDTGPKTTYAGLESIQITGSLMSPLLNTAACWAMVRNYSITRYYL